MIDDLDTNDFTMESLLDGFRDSMQEELHTALPGKIESYDASIQHADITPLIHRRIPRDDGTFLSEPLPTIRSVPIIFPRSSDWFVHLPLAAGDTVLLVVCERDLARWLQTGEASDPLDLRHHSLAHAVAIPGLFSRKDPISSSNAPSDAIVIGKDGGATIRIKNAEIDLGTSATEKAVRGDANKTAFDNFRSALSTWIIAVKAGIVAGGGTLDNTTFDAAIAALGTAMSNSLSNVVKIE